MIVVAHRGAWDDAAPENTLAAIERAVAIFLARGVRPRIELDLRASRDGTPFCFHDRTLSRFFDRDEAFEMLSDEEIRRLRLNGHPIPSLSEVVEAVPGDAVLHLEWKTRDPEAVGRWRPIFARREVVASSFSLEMTRAFAAAGLPFHHLAKELPEAPVPGAAALDLSLDAADAVRAARAAGLSLPVFFYVVNDAADLARARAAGAEGVFSDRPDRILSLL